MTVLSVYRTYFPDPPGGLQEAIRQICLATSKLGVNNQIFTLSPNPIPNEIVFDEAKVIRERSWMAPASCDLGGAAAFLKFGKLAKESDVLHYFHPWPFADMLQLGCRPHAPAMMTYISDVVRQKYLSAIYAPLMWSTLKKMQVIVANCPAYVDSSPILSQPEIRKKIRVIPLGIDEHSYSYDGDESILEKAGVIGNEPFFLFLGVLRYYKGLHTLISAAKNIDAKVVVAGSGPEKSHLEALVLKHNLKNIIFVGQVTNEQKVTLLKHCFALILPSHLRSEAYGMVLVEASMFGKPMITCEIGTGTSFVNKHEETGLVISPESNNELHAAMKSLLSDTQLVEHLGKNARIRYEKNFSSAPLGTAYKQIYDELAVKI